MSTCMLQYTMTGLLSVIACGNRLHNYSRSLTGAENTPGGNNLMKSWENHSQWLMRLHSCDMVGKYFQIV